jgi:hypothetical protein
MKEHKYVPPTVRVHASFSEARYFLDKRRDLLLFEKEAAFSIDALADDRRLLVLGEPGVGKTMLLQKAEEYFTKQGFATRRLSLAHPAHSPNLKGFASYCTSFVLFAGIWKTAALFELATL